MILIVAVDDKFGIGKQGDLLTYLPEDLEFFKEKTLNKGIIIGRKTLESFKNGKPLPKRHHYVLSRNKVFEHDRVTTIASVEELLQVVKDIDPETLFVSGGGTIYEALLPYCHKAYVTRIDEDFGADTFMPALSKLSDWQCVFEGEWLEFEGKRYRHTTWERKV
jgi:dihydrofolate reductase